VALDALGDNPVDGVASGAGEVGVFALVFPQLLYLPGMTGETGVGHIAGEGDLEGSMGVLVATEAPLQFIVRFTRMALAALGDVVFGRGTMGCMAIEAGYGLMSGARGRNILGRRLMALDAIVNRQGVFCRALRYSGGCKTNQQWDENTKCYSMTKPLHFNLSF
jgi:hypothetical protein